MQLNTAYGKDKVMKILMAKFGALPKAAIFNMSLIMDCTIAQKKTRI